MIMVKEFLSIWLFDRTKSIPDEELLFLCKKALMLEI